MKSTFTSAFVFALFLGVSAAGHAPGLINPGLSNNPEIIPPSQGLPGIIAY